MIPSQTVQQILDIARIEDVVGDFVTLKRRGASFVACCPFHNEKTPSFYVTPSKGIFKCFGCGKSGTSVGFVMEHEHCTYGEALRFLAHKYHIEIVEKEESAEEIALRHHRESLLLVSEFAQKFFASQLESGEGRAVGYQYFRSRGMQDDTIRHFGLGWAPSGRTSLIDAATAQGYKMEYLLAAGLAVQREDGSITDKFRERVMFPIYSVSGRVVAFSGRTLKADNPAKYVNSPDTEIYHKSNNLLGIYHAKEEISRQHRCILVEGNVDMVTMHQLGITNVVASCGTALTIDQIRLISRFTAPDNNITIMYDGDSAGIHAALRGLGLVLSEGLNVKIVLLPDGEDPDSFCRRHSLEEVNDFLARNEKDFIRFKTDLLLQDAAGDPLKKANLINDIADTVALIPDPVKRSVYIDDVASRFGIEPDILHGRIRKDRQALAESRRKDAEREARQNAPSAAPDGTPEQREERQAPAPEGPNFENKTLAQPEKDLLSFLLKNGCDEMEFPTDSEYFSAEKLSVADFIRSALESDGSEFANSIFRSVYNAYFQLYDAGLKQDDIIKRMMDSPDRQMASAAAQLCIEKYPLTVDSFQNSLMSTPSWLVNFVPKAIFVYAAAKVHDNILKLKRNLVNLSEDDQQKSLAEIIKLQKIEKKIKAKIGR